MKINALHVRRFRSIERAGLPECRGLNILIGKNNAGKSNLLSALELAVSHLKGGVVAIPWDVPRPNAEFTDRDASSPIQIGLEFELPPTINERLRERLLQEASNLERSVEQLREVNKIAFIISADISHGTPYIWLSRCSVGALCAEEGVALPLESVSHN